MALGYARNQHDRLTSTLCLSEPALPSAVPGDLLVLTRVFLRWSQGNGPKEYDRDQ